MSYINEVLPVRKRRMLTVGSFASAVTLSAVMVTGALWVNQHLSPQPSTSVAQELKLEADDAFKLNGEPHVAFTLPDGERLALPTDELLDVPTEYTVYQLQSVSTDLIRGIPFYSAGDMRYSVEPLKAYTPVPYYQYWTAAALIALLALTLMAMFSLVVFDTLTYGMMPSVLNRSKGFSLPSTDTFKQSSGDFFRVILMGVFAYSSVLVFSAALHGLRSIETGLPEAGAVLTSLVLTILLGAWTTTEPFRVAAARVSARTLWPSASTLKCSILQKVEHLRRFSYPSSGPPVLSYRTDVWPLSWAAKHGLDMEVFNALGAFEFEGTLGDLLTASKTLGSD